MAENNAEEVKGKGSKKILFAALGTVLAAGVGVAGYLAGSGSATAGAQSPLVADVAEAGRGADSAAIGPLVAVESFVINILDDKDTRYLKASITLDLDRIETVEEAQSRMPQLRDAILLLIGNKTYNEVRDLQGKLQLRAELKDKINDILQTGKVRRIYFTDFVVQ